MNREIQQLRKELARVTTQNDILQPVGSFRTAESALQQNRRAFQGTRCAGPLRVAHGHEQGLLRLMQRQLTARDIVHRMLASLMEWVLKLFVCSAVRSSTAAAASSQHKVNCGSLWGAKLCGNCAGGNESDNIYSG